MKPLCRTCRSPNHPDRPGGLCWPCYYGPTAKLSGKGIHRPWTESEDATLRAEWGKKSARAIGLGIGRTRRAVQLRAKALQLAHPKFNTPEQIETVLRMHATHTAADVAEAAFGDRTKVGRVYNIAGKLGLRKWPSHPPAVIAQVKTLHADGLSDMQIRDALGEAFSGSKGYEQVKSIRKDRLKLLANRDPESKRRSVRTQFARLGVKNAGELRALAYRKYAVECGWPDDLPPRAVQILNVLAEHGPQTSAALAEKIGRRVEGKRNCQLLSCSANSSLINGHGTYTGLLKARGLIINQHRSLGPVAGSGKARLPGLYILTPAAIQIREECLERIQRNTEPRPEAGLHTDDAGGGSSTHTGADGRGRVGRSAA